MWLTRRLFPQQGVRVRSGQVAGGLGFSVRGESDYRSPRQLFPYGFSSAASAGSQAVLVDGYCAGMASAPDDTLLEGEVRLYSSGGAEIWLKRNGDVVINGQVFRPGGE